jgi:hypothetical protein
VTLAELRQKATDSYAWRHHARPVAEGAKGAKWGPDPWTVDALVAREREWQPA